MTKLSIEIDVDGSVQIAVKGHAGPGCKDLTKAIEQALGEVKEDRKTPEYFQPAKQQLKVKA